MSTETGHADVYLRCAWAMPTEVNVAEIAEDAAQAAFALIGARLQLNGYPVTGDFSPEETHRIQDAFELFVRSMALNSPHVARLQDEEDDEGRPAVTRYEIREAADDEPFAEFDALSAADALARYSLTEGFADPRETVLAAGVEDFFYLRSDGYVGMVFTNTEVYAVPLDHVEP